MDKYHNIHTLFHAGSIAIIGATKDLDKVGGRPIQYLQTQGFKGKIYPINPNHKEIAGLKVYRDILQIPDDVDVAIIALPVRYIEQAIEDCAKKGVKTAVVFTAGFAEVGDEGIKLQQKLVSIAHENNMSLVGPNCFGVANVLNGTICSFAETFSKPIDTKGTIGFVSQSGGIGFNLLDHALHQGIGFNYWATTGNEADLNFLDFVSYLLERPEVNVIGGYIEALKDGKEFRLIAKRAMDLRKPLVLLKVGTTEAGQSAVTSHTGSLAGADTVYDTSFRQNGVIRVKDKTELLDTLRLCEADRKPKGSRVGIVTASGGNGIMMTDCAIEYGLGVTPTSSEIKEKLVEKLPDFGSANNPIDVTAQVINNLQILRECMELVVEEEQFDTIVIAAGGAYRFLEDIKDLISKTDKLICIVSPDVSPQTKELAKKYGIPHFDDISRCMKAVANVAKFEQAYQRHVRDNSRETKAPLAIPDLQLPGCGGIISEGEAKAIFSSLLPIPEGQVVSTVEEAINVSKKIGYPVVMKLNSSKIAHKTNVGGVKINLLNEKDVSHAFEEIKNNLVSIMPDIDFEGVLVEKFSSDKGIEVVVGFNKDPIFGHFITFGLGGVFVEVLQDFSMRILPVNEEEIYNLIKEIKGWPILQGYRGDASYDIDALVKAIANLSAIVEKYGDRIGELEINPIKVLSKGNGIIALDALLKLE